MLTTIPFGRRMGRTGECGLEILIRLGCLDIQNSHAQKFLAAIAVVIDCSFVDIDEPKRLQFDNPLRQRAPIE
jgi:hypothetical protein